MYRKRLFERVVFVINLYQPVQALHTKSITMGKEKAEAYNSRLILQVLFDSCGRCRNSK